ncbi:hypothetical protein L596_007887 [Steinernema carpocapsae]|uniref:Uncharacterized protein n=1 Tax=Steinernema carpocapsae TaxID=34508 RepID=A0A4U5PAR3_STECR|nr:hypothetical protein L596_007887 [Steinernema carpocapsae]
MCLAEEGTVWEGSFCQIKCPVAGRSVVHVFTRNAVFFVKILQTKDAKSSNSLITYDFVVFCGKNHDFTPRSCSLVNLPPTGPTARGASE